MKQIIINILKSQITHQYITTILSAIINFLIAKKFSGMIIKKIEPPTATSTSEMLIPKIINK